MFVTPHISISMLLGSALHVGGVLLWPELSPLRIGAFILLLLGYFGLLNGMGLGKPLNLLSAILAGYAAVSHMFWLLQGPDGQAFGFVYVLTLLTAFLITSIAALHRDGAVRRAGAWGGAAIATSLFGVVIGHVLLGGFGFLALGWGLSGNQDTLSIWPMELVLAAWIFAAGMFVLVGVAAYEKAQGVRE